MANPEKIKLTDKTINQLMYSMEPKVQILSGFANKKVSTTPKRPVTIDHLLRTRIVFENSILLFSACAKATILTPLILIPNPVTEEMMASVFCKSPTIPIPVVPKNKATNLEPTNPTSIFKTCEKPKTPVAFKIVLCDLFGSIALSFKYYNQNLVIVF